MLEAITRRVASITVKIHDICTPDIFHVFTRTKAGDSLERREWMSLRDSHESCLIGTMVMHKAWNGEKLSLLSENVCNGLQER